MSDVYNLGPINGISITELFNGSATAGNSYPLNDDISNYKFLIVFTTVNNGTYAFSNKSYSIINVNTIQHTEFEFMTSTNNGSVYYSIIYSFTDNTTLKINSITVTTWTNPRIYKILGIK